MKKGNLDLDISTTNPNFNTKLRQPTICLELFLKHLGTAREIKPTPPRTSSRNPVKAGRFELEKWDVFPFNFAVIWNCEPKS